MCTEFNSSLSFFIAINALYSYTQLVTAWHSFSLESEKPLKNIRPFRTAPWGGYRLKPQIMPSFLWDNSNIIPEEFWILPAVCEPVSLVSRQNSDLAAHRVFHVRPFLKHTSSENNNNKKVVMQPYLISCQNVFWSGFSDFYLCSVVTFPNRLHLYESQCLAFLLWAPFPVTWTGNSLIQMLTGTDICRNVV